MAYYLQKAKNFIQAHPASKAELEVADRVSILLSKWFKREPNSDFSLK